MKRILLILTAFLSLVGMATAQNANRSGVFLELGGGPTFGTKLLKDVEWTGSSLIVKKAGSGEANLGVGYRKASSRVFAWEIKAQLSTMPSDLEGSHTFALMPGFRYTTKELFGNVSMYFGLNAGVAIMPQAKGYYYGGIDLIIGQPDYMDFDNGLSVGGKIDLQAGLNLTTKIYLGLFFDCTIIEVVNADSQVFYDGSLDINREFSSLYSAGLRIGFKF